MLHNVSYHDPGLDREIDKAVGRPFGWTQRFMLRGIGSPKMRIASASPEVQLLLRKDGYPNTCNIELRPRGIIVRFRSRLETYALIIPYYKLSLYKGRPDEYGIYRDQHFVRVRADARVHAFMKRVVGYQAEAAQAAQAG